MPKISYDPEVQILSIRLSDEKIADSDLEGDLVIDYNAKGGIVNIDIMHFDLKKLSKIK